MSKTIKIILGFVLIAIVALGTTFFLAFTNNGSEGFKTFYIKHDNKTIMTSKALITLTPGELERFDCIYTFGSQNPEFNVKITPSKNYETNFEFTVNDSPYLFSAEKNLTGVFNLKEYDGYFTIQIENTDTLESLLQKLYPASTVKVPDNIKEIEQSREVAFYTLEIGDYNNNIVYYIDFSLAVNVTGVELTPEIEFIW